MTGFLSISFKEKNKMQTHLWIRALDKYLLLVMKQFFVNLIKCIVFKAKCKIHAFFLKTF